jgi:hypothetical protein
MKEGKSVVGHLPGAPQRFSPLLSPPLKGAGLGVG